MRVKRVSRRLKKRGGQLEIRMIIKEDLLTLANGGESVPHSFEIELQMGMGGKTKRR